MSDHPLCGAICNLFTGSLLAVMPMQVYAQSGKPAQATADAATTSAEVQNDTSAIELDAITVVAQKRSQNLQRVPVAITAISGEQLEANGVQSFTDLNRVAPSLTIKPAEQPMNASLTIRGVGTYASTIAVEPSVAVIIDDAPVGFQGRIFTALSDLDHIEVLRGPQSTLYGKSASAGLINIVTAGPSDDWRIKYSSAYTSDDAASSHLVISGPITDTLKFRSVLNYTYFQGNVRNLFDGRNLNGNRDFSALNKVSWAASDALKIDAAVNYVRGYTSTGTPFLALSPAARLNGRPALTPAVFAPGITAGKDNTRVVNDVVAMTRYTDKSASLRVSYDVGDVTFMSITAYDTFKAIDRFHNTNSPALFNPLNGDMSSRQVSQEFRLLSPDNTRLRYTLGLYYADIDSDRYIKRGPVYALAEWRSTAYSRQIAAFGQFDYDLFPATTLSAGLRYGNEDVGYSFADFQNGNAFFSGDTRDKAATYKLGLQQQLSKAIMLYASVASGYKGATYNLVTGFNAVQAAAGPVRPETSKNYEIGARMQLLDRRLTLNTTVFDTYYRDFQAQGSVIVGTLIQPTLANVGRLRTRGIEEEIRFRASQNLTLGLGLTYNQARITAYPNAPCYPGQTAAQGCVASPAGKIQNLAGATPPLAPRWKYTASLEYIRDLGNSGRTGFVNLFYAHQGKINYSLNQDPLTVQKGYGIANLSFGIRAEDQRWEVMAFVNNLFNAHYATNIVNQSGAYGGQLAIFGYVPRDFYRYGGVRVTYRFE